MLTAFDADDRFVSYGTYVICGDGETYGAFPDDDRAVRDCAGNDLVKFARSRAYGFRLYRLKREDKIPYALRSVDRVRVCVVMGKDDDEEMDVLGFSHWFAQTSSCTIRFAQSGDPRMNGAPVVDRKTKELVGMYLVRSWADDTRAECVPCDALAPKWEWPEPDARRAYSLRRAFDNEDDVPTRLIRAIELDDYVFVETHDGKAKWAAHVYAHRDFVYENQCKLLRDSFADVVRFIEQGRRVVFWSNDEELAFVREPKSWGFHFNPRTAPLTPDPESRSFPCIDWL